jgi:hypothetical protein
MSVSACKLTIISGSSAIASSYNKSLALTAGSDQMIPLFQSMFFFNPIILEDYMF